MSSPANAAPGRSWRAWRDNRALRFVLLIGILSFFADFTYEGARSVLGPFLLTLGASATAIGIVTGFGELAGYGLRLLRRAGTARPDPAGAGLAVRRKAIIASGFIRRPPGGIAAAAPLSCVVRYNIHR